MTINSLLQIGLFFGLLLLLSLPLGLGIARVMDDGPDGRLLRPSALPPTPTGRRTAARTR